ncbi:Fis family transcriptional regulator [Leptolyngbya sp. CCNP1308]|uniref:Fis family transcriptional regulator n=1 Tax=Leptolyngbya sp. CCNP1308 TaxID=3110255 RepID=UPI002B21CD4C|nr:Fis family transcriptional regulator [Leptolyngbya sp. CCNP1308]MEA5452822.1 Fis family transcriptional regulator [Leptolyngbya sp. CCNP1308]
MVEPLSLLAGAITTYVVPKALEKVGEKVGEAALAKSGAAIQATRRAVQDKLTATQTAGVLAIAEAEPTDANLKLLETVLLTQMRQDQLFAEQLQALNQQIQAQSPGLQAVLDTVRVRGNVEVGNVEQVSETGVAEQIVGRNLGVGGDLKIGDITQKQ